MLLAGAAFGLVFSFLVPGAVVILVPSFGTVVTESVRVGVAVFEFVETFLSVVGFVLVAGGVFWFGLVLAGLAVCAMAGKQPTAKIKASKLFLSFFIAFILSFIN